MIANIKTVKKILETNSLKAKKKFGQNFLVDNNIIKKIVDVSNVKNCGVIEIGPGIGSLTLELVKESKKVLCYEIDPDMINILKENIKASNLKIVNKDILKVDILSDLSYFSDCSEVKVVSNLPYYITTPIIFKLLETDSLITDFYFMVQKEVAERICARVNTKDYNSLSVLIEFSADSEICFFVGRNCFYPAPNVDSAIIHIKKVKKDYSVNNKAKFLKFVQNIFSLRRKTLVNNINNTYGIKKEKIIETLEKRGYKNTLRSEELSLSEMIDLYNDFFVN